MAESFLPEIFYPTVQAFLPAGRAEGGKRGFIAKGGFAYAVRCLRTCLAGRAGKDRNRKIDSLFKNKEFPRHTLPKKF